MGIVFPDEPTENVVGRTFKYKGNKYFVLEEIRIRNNVGDWSDGVLYMQLDNKCEMKFVRIKSAFAVSSAKYSWKASLELLSFTPSALPPVPLMSTKAAGRV